MQQLENHPQINKIRLIIVIVFIVLIGLSHISVGNSSSSKEDKIKYPETIDYNVSTSRIIRSAKTLNPTTVYKFPEKKNILGALPADVKVDIISEKVGAWSEIKIKNGTAWVLSKNLSE